MMKSFSILLIIFLSGFILDAQDPTEITTQVAKAIRQGDAVQLASFFGQTIDITLTSSEGTYSKTQATLIMKDFFSQHPPTSFEIKHQGTSDNGSLYIIGTYVTGKLTYRTYLLLKNIASVYTIQQIQFEEE